MFREMRRKKQQLSPEECAQLLIAEKRGVLSVLGDDGYPYGMPMDFWYDPQSGKLYFHGSQSGHKQDAIARCDKVSFCVYGGDYREEGQWAWNVKSVIIFGRIKPVEDAAQALHATRMLGNKYTSDTAYVEKELQQSAHHLRCLELTPEHISGKLVNES